MKLGRGIEFASDFGGNVILSEERMDLEVCGIEDGYVFFEDTYINTHDDLYIDMEDGNTTVTLEHEGYETVIEFEIVSSVPSGMADFRFNNLKPEEWYRLKLDGTIASTESGNAHGQTSANGRLVFRNIIIPNE